jgi:predicted AlkP superfamily phosphohydrolase/phosphomutase
VYFRTPDLMSHYYWGDFERSGPVSSTPADVEEADRNRELIFRAYEGVDRSIADLLAAADRPINVFVLSDHGFHAARPQRWSAGFDLNALLERLGYLTRNPDGSVDVERSRAYTFASGRIRANEMVRFGTMARRARPDGGAGPISMHSALRTAVERDLARITWADGRPAVAVTEATARQVRHGADFEVQLLTDSAVKPLLLDGEPIEGIVGEIRRISGGHSASTDGLLIASGPDIAAGAALDGIHIRDIAPTVLYGLDAPVAEDFAGRPWRELYTEAFQKVHPVRSIASWGTRDARRPYPSAEDETMLDELRGLGYLD